MTEFSRRTALKLLGAGTALISSDRLGRANDSEGDSTNAPYQSSWRRTPDRIWVGPEYWANPMEDWRIVDGAAECMSNKGFRCVHSLTHQLRDPHGKLQMSVDVEQVESPRDADGFGFRVGIASDINEYRANCFSDTGINAGIKGNELVLGKKRSQVPEAMLGKRCTLKLSGAPRGDRYELTLRAYSADGTSAEIVSEFAPHSILGNVAIANSFDRNMRKGGGGRHRFRNWTIDGDAFEVDLQQAFGPVLWSMYSLSDSRSPEGFVMKMSALTGPLGDDDNQTVELQVEQDGQWKSLGVAELDNDAWVATFRIPNWNEQSDAGYRLLYRQEYTDGSNTVFERRGTIRANPSGRSLKIGALTCQNDYAFPYEPVAQNLLKIDPDLLYFSGDQLYESHGGYGLIRNPADRAILNYLRKFYQFGWAFGEAMRDRPTLCIPDDHDVFQGNLWGEGGKPMARDSTSSGGGYREPARMVNVVHKTSAGHHPDYFDPAPCEQDISVYYGDMVYGGVGFAILGDRQFKSGPGHVDTGSGRQDHVVDPDLDLDALDQPGLELLGDRQEKFLEHWVNDWNGHSMKILLSQTVFAGVATHHGGYDGYLRADLDSGSWPQTPRNRTIAILREGMPLHINGDQHLTSLVQYGVDGQRDSCWSFCTPAIAVGYPRWWRPDEVGMPHVNRPQHDLPNTGEYLDCFGNKAYVYAVGNPEVGKKKHRYQLAHQKGSGFGVVTVDTNDKTYKCEAFRFLCDATDGNTSNQFPGWPLTIHQQENIGENRIV